MKLVEKDSLAAYSDHSLNYKVKGMREFDEEDGFSTPLAGIPHFDIVRNQSAALNSTRASNLNMTTIEPNPECYVSVVEGRGSAQGEVGIATNCLI